MSRKTFPLCLGLFLWAAPFFAVLQEEADKQANAIVLQFLQARQIPNLDDLMKTVDVPWYHDRKSVITERKELQDEFHTLLSRKNQPKVSYTVKRIRPYRVMQNDFTEDERRMTDRVLTAEDRIVLVAVQQANADQEKIILIFVRLREGPAKVVGIKN